MAEKLAALQVVRKRLDEAGLGTVCLELHSNKTKKHALLNDVAARIKAQGSFRDPRDLEHVLAGLLNGSRGSRLAGLYKLGKASEAGPPLARDYAMARSQNDARTEAVGHPAAGHLA